MTYRLQRVVVEGFRAYGTRTEFDCSGDVVALVGPNGWGKTSFFDAITWCLFGRIPRLAGTRDFVGEEFIRNRFSPEIPPYVSVGLEGDGEAVVVARDSAGLHVATGTAEYESTDAEDWIRSLVRGQTLPDEYGPDQDENDELAVLQDDPETLFLRCHHLSQDQMAAFLRESSPRERFDTLASLLGLDVIRSFYRHTSSVSKDLGNEVEDARRQQLQVEQRLASLRSELDEIESLDDGTSPTIDRLVSEFARLRSEAGALIPSPTGEETDVRSPTDLAERARDLALQLADLGDRMELRSEELASLRDNMQAVVDQGNSATQLASSRADAEEEVGALRQSAEELELRLRGESEKDEDLSRRLAEEDQRRQELTSFLILADRHLFEDHCPVCGQSISLDEVKATVAQRLGSLPDELIDLQREKNAAESVVAALEQERNGLEARLRSAEERLAALDRQFSVRSATLENFKVRLGELGVDSQAPGLRERLTSGYEAAIKQARMARSLARECDAVGRRAAFLGARDRLSRLREQTGTQQEALSSILSEVHSLSSATNVAGSVVVAARRAERDLVRSMLTSIEPILDVLYGRLRPHPVLDRLRLDIGSFDEKGEVRFVAYSPGTEANVSTIFSSAQLNAVAVCVFMAMNLAISRSQAAFALLDDPIQNMDDFNVLGLLDLLRGLIGERQFVVSTHDEQIGELLRRKLRPLAPGAQTILHRFLSYRGDGPFVETLIDDYVEAPHVLERAAGE
jgi:DNA repair exonuclease SbcCD ATPase subunit